MRADRTDALHIGVIGAGAAGVAAARTLRERAPDADIELVNITNEAPANRTLVNKGVAVGLLEPHQAVVPVPDVQVVNDSAVEVAPAQRLVTFASGRSRVYDALIIATGSAPRSLDQQLPGYTDAVAAKRLTTLHSFADAELVRDRLALAHPARVVILGGGLVAAETASLLVKAGHGVALVSRSLMPGSTAFGDALAAEILDLHRAHLLTYLGRTTREINTHDDHVALVLDDGVRVSGDLVIVAHGTHPSAPAPWAGLAGVPVDARLRWRDKPDGRIYAAGGVARHRQPGGGDYRIDHWDDAVAQGVHAAGALLHDAGLGDDPGAYMPRSMFLSSIHGRMLAGAGHAWPGTSSRVVSETPLVVLHKRERIPVAVAGLDSVALIREWQKRLHLDVK